MMSTTNIALENLCAHWLCRTNIAARLRVHVERQDQIEVGCLLPSMQQWLPPRSFSCHPTIQRWGLVGCVANRSVGKLIKSCRNQPVPPHSRTAGLYSLEVLACCRWATIRIASKFPMQQSHSANALVSIRNPNSTMHATKAFLQAKRPTLSNLPAPNRKIPILIQEPKLHHVCTKGLPQPKKYTLSS